MAGPRRSVAWMAAALAAVVAARAGATETPPLFQPADYHDGHARPRALAFNAADGLLYVALSTADTLAIVDPGATPRIAARVRVCRFPDAVVALPGGGALVSCRFEPGLRRVARDGRAWRVGVVDAGPEGGARGLALSPDGALAYVASPATPGVNVVSLARGGVVQTIATGLSPRALRVVPAGALPRARRPLLLVSSFIDHEVTVHPIEPDGRLAPVVQTIVTEAPVLDALVAEGATPALWLLTHEDRPLSRLHLSIEGLDSGVLQLPARAGGKGGPPFEDAGPQRRSFANLSERGAAPVIELAAAARDARSGTVAIAGAGTDDVLIVPPGARDPRAGVAVTVGADPVAVAALPDARFVSADRLSDTLTFISAVAGPRVDATLDVGVAARTSPAELGEILFYSRALTPKNVADGPLSLYTCAACHDDGHVDGRRHPSKRNRFFSMTKTCRGLGTTAPYLSLGEPATIDAFADNIVATHAQGAEHGPDDYDRYPVALRVRGARAADGWKSVVLSPVELRAALAAYMARIPPEPSPFATGRHALSTEERRGLAVFRESCAGCHELVGDTALGNPVPARELERRLLAGQVALTSARLYDVGTPVLGKTGNNPPSLRGVWDAAPYFSDGSARSLDDVLRRTDPSAPKVHAPENAERPPALSPEARAALLTFLRAL
jgi:hypothetical protein